MKPYQIIGLVIVGIAALAVVGSANLGQPLVQDIPFALIILGIIAAVLVGWAARRRKHCC